MKKLGTGNITTAVSKELEVSIYMFGIVSVPDEPIQLTFEGQSVQYFTFSEGYQVVYCHLSDRHSLNPVSETSLSSLDRMKAHHQVNIALQRHACFLPFQYGTRLRSEWHFFEFIELKKDDLVLRCQQTRHLCEYRITIAITEYGLSPIKADKGRAFFMKKYQQHKNNNTIVTCLKKLNEAFVSLYFIRYSKLTERELLTVIDKREEKQFQQWLIEYAEQHSEHCQWKVSGPWALSDNTIQEVFTSI